MTVKKEEEERRIDSEERKKVVCFNTIKIIRDTNSPKRTSVCQLTYYTRSVGLMSFVALYLQLE